MHKGSMQGRIQVVEQSRCRTHRQQTTTIAEMQSPQSVLKGIENLHYFYKNKHFLQAEMFCFIHSCSELSVYLTYCE